MSDVPLAPRPAPARNPGLGHRVIRRSDRCINCGTCIKACTYGCHERTKKSEGDAREMAEPVAGCCRACFACVLFCPREALSMHRSETFDALGEENYTPAIIRSIWEQAALGKIPVSGGGYGGPFSGEGYDGIWTDMSEIVRPTRDGIHGRERISTAVSVGRKIADLCGMHFDPQGNLTSQIPPHRDIPFPILFGSLPFFPQKKAPKQGVLASIALAATRLTTYATLFADQDTEDLQEYFNHLIIRLRPDEIEKHKKIVEWATIVEFESVGDPIAAIARVRAINPHLLTSIRVPASKNAKDTILEIARRGGESIHLAADRQGRGKDITLLDCLQECHRLLVEHGLRDQITLLASGGIAAAEHVPKTIILGADVVVIDLPLLIAMECTLCGDCEKDKECPRDLGGLDPRWGATRIINLMVSWRDQLLEMLGAMGLRDVRRLRGETGRIIVAKEACAEFSERIAENSGSKKVPLAPTPIAPVESKAPHRFPITLGAHEVMVEEGRCIHCGICAETCRFDVHRRQEGRLLLDEPRHGRCIGPRCEKENDWCCIGACPTEAISLSTSNTETVLGDRRWTAELLRDTWRQAESDEALITETQDGDSGGGFDTLRLARGDKPHDDPIDLSIPLNKRKEGPELTIPLPIYGGGMSYGSISLQVMVGRAMAAQEIGTMISTGEGGYPSELIPFKENIITQIATGLFGVREETIQRSPMVEFKYAQGAKPGLGGHLLGEKNTAKVSSMREAVPGTSLFSPFPFHSVYSVEDHKKHLDWMRAIHPEILVSVKVSTPADVDMVAVGAFYAGANVIHLDGAYGGTGAAPDIAKKNIAQPIELGTVQVHDFLEAEGIRDEVVLIASGGIRSPEDVLKAIALGADGVVIGTADLVAIGCVRCGNCERDRGCPIGIATTDPELAPLMTATWVRDRIVNMYRSWAAYLEQRLRGLGMRKISDLRGRRDLLTEVR